MTPGLERAFVLLLALIPMSAALPARAGDPPTASPGNRVRLEYREPVRKSILFVFTYTVRESRHVAGELVAITTDSVTIRPDGDWDAERRALAEIDGLSVSTGRRRHALGGCAGGFLIGLLLSTPITRTEDEYGEPTGSRDAALAVMIGSTVIGGIIGYLDVSDRWERAAPTRPTVTVVPVRDGCGVGVRMACGF